MKKKPKATRKKDPKLVVLEVMIKRTYAFPDGAINGWPVEKVIEDWFARWRMTAPHETRDSYAVGNSEEFVSVRRIE